MTEPYISLAAGFIGALIGALASIITMMVQTKIQDRRQRQNATIQLALEDYKIHLEALKSSNKPFVAYPIVLYLHYYLELVELMDKHKLTERKLQELLKENRRVRQLLEKWTKDNP